MEYGKLAAELYKDLHDDPEYIAAGLMIEINEQFCARMKELKITQRELAKRIGKSQPYVAKFLNHGANMTLETIALFAKALDLEIPKLIFQPKDLEYVDYKQVVDFHKHRRAG